MQIEMHFVTEFGVKNWSFHNRFDSEDAIDIMLQSALRYGQKYDENSKARVVKVTREIVE